MAKKPASPKSKELKEAKSKKIVVDLDKLAKDNETTTNATDYQAYIRNRMKGIKLV